MSRSQAVVSAVLAIGALASPLPAAAMSLSFETTFNGATNVPTNFGVTNSETNPGGDGYFHHFTAPTTCCVSDGSTTPSFGFYDDYVFTVAAGITNSLTTTIDLGTNQISNLQERLYIVNAGGLTNPVPTLGLPPSGTVLEGWQAGAPGSTVLTINNSLLAAGGTYALQIRGNVTGASGGTYSGSINFSPLPLPAALPLLLGGLGLLGLRRRKG